MQVWRRWQKSKNSEDEGNDAGQMTFKVDVRLTERKKGLFFLHSWCSLAIWRLQILINISQLKQNQSWHAWRHSRNNRSSLNVLLATESPPDILLGLYNCGCNLKEIRSNQSESRGLKKKVGVWLCPQMALKSVRGVCCANHLPRFPLHYSIFSRLLICCSHPQWDWRQRLLQANRGSGFMSTVWT